MTDIYDLNAQKNALREPESSNLVARLRAKAAKGGIIPIHDMAIEDAANELERLARELEHEIYISKRAKNRLIDQDAEITRLRAMLERAAGTLNSLRADVEGTLWPNSGFAAPEPRDG